MASLRQSIDLVDRDVRGDGGDRGDRGTESGDRGTESDGGISSQVPVSYPLEPSDPEHSTAKPHASPLVRAFARQLGVNLATVQGCGPNERVRVEDVQAYVRDALAQIAGGGSSTTTGMALSGSGDASPSSKLGQGLHLVQWPKIDFASFGPVEITPLSRIKRISGANLARNWMMIPHVTQHDDADVTSLEEFRQQINRENEKAAIKVTMLAFVIKAVVAALKAFPDFNASLDGDQLVHKRYFHIGFAADTPEGLVVPVIRNADRKGVLQIAEEMTALAALAREGKLGAADMQGGCFSVSSLGGIGGTYFTPIINAPEVAIIGLGKARVTPVWDGLAFVPTLMLPLSLSYDHRVIDGAMAARFTTFLGTTLRDFCRVIL